jgi:hypothetical protein
LDWMIASISNVSRHLNFKTFSTDIIWICCWVWLRVIPYILTQFLWLRNCEIKCINLQFTNPKTLYCFLFFSLQEREEATRKT